VVVNIVAAHKQFRTVTIGVQLEFNVTLDDAGL
jgi:hypothetical protein